MTPPATCALGLLLLLHAAVLAEEPLPEIEVAAPEPRYVAPTRHDRIGRIWAPVLINGLGPFRLVLDTGATRTAVTPQVVAALGLPVQPDGILLRGVTGSARVPAIVAERIEVGDLITAGGLLPVIEDAFGGAQGVLGTEGLRQMRIVIEFNADRITIVRSRNQPPAHDFTGIPLRFLQGYVPVIQARVGGIPVKAIVDTGAQVTTGNLALREAIARRRPAVVPRTETILGVTLDEQPGEVLTVARIELGPLNLEGARVTFADLAILELWDLLEEPTLLLGMDVLGRLDTLIIDYRRRELQVRLNAQPRRRRS
jgi:predicted aspartyl protease